MRRIKNSFPPHNLSFYTVLTSWAWAVAISACGFQFVRVMLVRRFIFLWSLRKVSVFEATVLQVMLLANVEIAFRLHEFLEARIDNFVYARTCVVYAWCGKYAGIRVYSVGGTR